jgi:Zn finger protein HypA/HybF involved in hydrogenase expression
VIEGIAYCDHEMEWMEAKVICPDCGHERHDVKETIGQMEIRRSAFEKALEGLR